MVKKPTTAIWLDNRRPKKDNRFPVKIRITYKRDRYYYPTNVNLTPVEFEQAFSSKPGAKFKEVNLKVTELEKQAIDAIDKIAIDLRTEFSVSLFEKQLGINAPDYNDVFNCYERKITQLNLTTQVKTAELYQTSMNSFKKFVNKDNLSFHEIDKHFLEKYEIYMLGDEKTLTTIGIYSRTLRTIFNDAIDEKLVSDELYPFGRSKYQVPQPANNKRALGQGDLVKIFNYQPEPGTWEDYAKDMWTLSLLCQGMNMKDITSLRFKNLQKDKITFIREKTKRLKKATQTPITVYISAGAIAIIKKWGNDSNVPDDYIFPICSDDNTPLRNMRIVGQQIKMINKYIRQIATNLEITDDVTFYAARHSFATTLKRQGRSIEEIQEFLGHADKRTTERYLDSFEDDHKRNIMSSFSNSLEAARSIKE